MLTSTRLITPAELPDRYALLRRSEAAALFHRSTKTLDEWIKAGRLPVVRIGARVLIRRSAVAAYLDALNPEHSARAEPAAAGPAAGAYISLNHAAGVLGIHRNTLDALTITGDLPRLRFGRSRVLPLEAVTSYIDAQSEPATTGPLAGFAG